MRYEIEKTEIFDRWLLKLRDRKAVLAITQRLDRAIVGNFGDVAPVGEGVSEIRKNTIIFMLCGGDKSTQRKDIKKAKKMTKVV